MGKAVCHKRGGTDLHTREFYGLFKKPGGLFLNVLFLNGLLFSIADCRQEADVEMLSQVLRTLQLELLIMAKTKLTKACVWFATANALVLSGPMGSWRRICMFLLLVIRHVNSLKSEVLKSTVTLFRNTLVLSKMFTWLLNCPNPFFAFSWKFWLKGLMWSHLI